MHRFSDDGNIPHILRRMSGPPLPPSKKPTGAKFAGGQREDKHTETLPGQVEVVAETDPNIVSTAERIQ